VTRSVPVVFPLVSDPVGAGFIESLARPGGNATGFMTHESSMSGKWLELLKEIVPALSEWPSFETLHKAPGPASSL
jgi:putative ABC transport system substrate-binding protein